MALRDNEMKRFLETKALEYPFTTTLAELIKLAEGDTTAEIAIEIPKYDDPTLFIYRVVED
jgi:hypothetical protein